MHLSALLSIGATLSCFGLYACGASAGTEHARSAEQWRTRAVEVSRFYLTNMCMDIAPIEVVDLNNADYRECVRQATFAIEAERDRIRGNALRYCVVDGQPEAACCFERMTSSVTETRRQAECNYQCSEATHRSPANGRAASCHPTIVDAPSGPPSRFYTDAVKAVEARCMLSPIARRECDGLNSSWERIMCHSKCERHRRSSVTDVPSDAGAGADDDDEPAGPSNGP